VDFWQQANLVRDRETLSKFLLAASRNFKEHPEGWENGDMSSFLEAMSGWIADCDEVFRRSGDPIPSDESWATIAKVVAAARVYE
jgi:hypothetical protein